MRYKMVKCDICGHEIINKKGMISAKRIDFPVHRYGWKDYFTKIDICGRCVNEIATTVNSGWSRLIRQNTRLRKITEDNNNDDNVNGEREQSCEAGRE